MAAPASQSKDTLNQVEQQSVASQLKKEKGTVQKIRVPVDTLADPIAQQAEDRFSEEAVSQNVDTLLDDSGVSQAEADWYAHRYNPHAVGQNIDTLMQQRSEGGSAEEQAETASENVDGTQENQTPIDTREPGRIQRAAQQKLGETRVAKRLKALKRQRKAAYLRMKRAKGGKNVANIKKIRNMIRVAKAGSAATLYGIVIAVAIANVELVVSAFTSYPMERWEKILTIFIDFLLILVLIFIVVLVYFAYRFSILGQIIEFSGLI